MVTSSSRPHSGGRSTRTVITGLGVVSPIGIGKDAFWDSLAAGRSGIGYLETIPSDHLPTKLAAEITNFDPHDFVPEKKFLKVMSRDIQLGVAAGVLAMGDAGLARGDVDPERLGVVFGCGRISTTPQELVEAVNAAKDHGIAADESPDAERRALTRWGEGAMGEIAPLWMLRQLPNMPACHVSIEFDARGPNNTITSRDASALLSLSEAACTIQRGAADCMIVGATSSNIHPVDIAKLSLFDGLSRRDEDPQSACRPFDFERDGTIVGEGSAVFVVESYEHAVARGADIYAEVLGVGSGCDGRGYENGAGGTGLVRAIEMAVSRSGLEPLELGHVNAHGKSTQRDDLVESRAYHRALGDAANRLPVTAMKSYFGHFDAGAGAVELAGTLLSLRHGRLPATLNYETPDPRCRLNIVHDGPRPLATRSALTVNRTTMGQSAAAVLRCV